MKRTIITLLLLLPAFFITLNSYSQCTPATPEQCPDPENNGQVCPDSLSVAHIGQLYSEVATIKPPATYMMADSSVIDLHHVKLMEVANLPEGITWQSNTPDSIFIAGEYYCVLMEGTPVLAGDYALRIVVDVYVVVIPGWPPINVATVTDSTSLKLVVIDDAGINGDNQSSLVVRHNFPNPFQSYTRIEFNAANSGPVDFDVYSLLGENVFHQNITAARGDNSLVFNGKTLPEGPYYYVFRSAGYKSTGIMIRKD